MKEQLTKLKEQLTHLNNNIADFIEVLDCAKDQKQLNIYLNSIWEMTKEIRNAIGSPNSRKN